MLKVIKLREKEKDILKNISNFILCENDDPINKNEEKVNSKKKKNSLYLVFVEVNNNLLKDLSLRAVLGGAYKSGTESEEEEEDCVVLFSPIFIGILVGSISIESSEP